MDKEQSFLCVGTPSNLLCYDVYNNKDVFFIDVPDGVQRLAFGKLAASDQPLVFVGGNCSIQGFDSKGEEQFWTVTGGTVTSMTYAPIYSSSDPESKQTVGSIIVGGDDFEIRSFQEEESMLEVVEADIVTHLCPLGPGLTGSADGLVGYGLKNGTIGIYAGTVRVWRIKAKDTLNCLIGFDINGDGLLELVSGWNSGVIEARSMNNGKLVYREHLQAAVATLHVVDDTLICCTVDGKVRGVVGIDDFSAKTSKPLPQHSNRTTDELSSDSELESHWTPRIPSEEQVYGESKALDAAEEEQRTAQFTVSALEGKLKHVLDDNVGDEPGLEQLHGAVVTVESVSSIASKCIELSVSVNNGLVLRTVVIVDPDGKVLESEAKVVCSDQPNASTLSIPLHPRKYNEALLKLQVMASVRGALSRLHLFEVQHAISKFKVFALDHSSTVITPDSHATFQLSQRCPQLYEGLAAAFDVEVAALRRGSNIAENPGSTSAEGDLDVTFTHVIKRSTLRIRVHTRDERRICTIHSEDMDVVAEVCQLVGTLARMNELSTQIQFDRCFETLKSLLDYVHQSKRDRVQLQGIVAQTSQIIKTLIVQAEDARILGDTGALKAVYQELASANRELLKHHTIRKNNNKTLTNALREMHEIIQCAARMRKGKFQTDVIKNARKALKMNSYTLLVQSLASSA